MAGMRTDGERTVVVETDGPQPTLLNRLVFLMVIPGRVAGGAERALRGERLGPAVLARAAAAIGESDEAARCAQFLRDSDPAAADALAG